MSSGDSTGSDKPGRPAGREPQLPLLYLRVLGGDLGAAQVWFDQAVLDKYRARTDFRVIRTNTAGRVRSPAGWALDFGIADDDRLIHASAGDLAQRLPPPERQHWVSHLVTPPLSRNFLTMRLRAGSCIDDGEVGEWPSLARPRSGTLGSKEEVEMAGEQGYANPAAVVSTEWVAGHLNDPNVRLIEVDVDTTAYDQGHIPGAVGFNWTTQLSDRIRRDIPTKEAWECLLGQAGLSRDSKIVFYGDNNNWFAAFAY